MASIGIVIVTYNRLDKLKIALDCFDAQSYAPKYVLVVDNASSDGTKEYLNGWQQASGAFRKIIITMDSNTGGSGGFYAGLERAVDLDADWIWVSDDDAFPEADALEQLNVFIESGKEETDNISAVCCQVVNHGKPDLFHRRSIIQNGFHVHDVCSADTDYKKEYFEIGCFSYVGAAISKKKLETVGLARKDYFIYYDDTEHSLRLSKAGKIYCVPSAKVHHDTVGEGGLSWKTYYGTRNKLDMIRQHFPGYVYAYYSLNLFARAIAARMVRRDKEKCRMYLKALKDCRAGRFGIDEVYKPGWQPQETR